MSRKGQKGSVTVFLSLTCILFLCLICAIVESVRLQGAKAQTANIVGMSNFSVLGEFEKQLLEDYDIFSVDGSYGSGSFGIEKVESRLNTFLTCNANPKEGVFSVWCFDPWQLQLTESNLSKYALLTDEDGEAFYQQAVAYMKTNTAAFAIDTLMEYAKNTDKIQEWEKEYERRKNENENSLEALEQERRDRMEELESEAEAGHEDSIPNDRQKNPLKEIAKLRKKSQLAIVTGDQEISQRHLTSFRLPSRKWLRKGTLKLEKKQKGLLANVLFREYLILHLPNYRSETQEGSLDYQIEYVLGGKTSDEKNLKYVVNRLLLLREGMNYLYCLGNTEMGMQAHSLAVTLTGFLGIPALTSATKHALLLAWAYGESLIDVRSLLDGGSVPLLKDDASWTLTLERLGELTEILKRGSSESEDGIDYAGYLRILLNMGSLKKQKLRALDMIQCNLQKKPGCENFKAENCIVAIQTDTKWRFRPVFAGLPRVVMGLDADAGTIHRTGSFAY